MKKNIFIISNSNFFTVLSQKFLKDQFSYQLLNVRYQNESMSNESHFIQQTKELFQAQLIRTGALTSMYNFSFGESLAQRLNTTINNAKPNLILFEMKTFEESEWLVLKYIKKNFGLPVVVHPSKDVDTEQVDLLLELGVREIIMDLTESSLRQIAKRNLANQV
ncbi:hypothetical protein [Guptibacillus spartinae]|uniref:hypothetical protein n=1 Tax=Guptibacillus spartinae TaxID=3025679 RepID=UPI0023606156|nr:hypothetical protein [Pseudalkalibacillus spartinae]